MKLITEAQYAKLLANGRAARANNNIDPRPVVKLFTPGGYSRWLLTEIDPNGTDRAFGLCDLGYARPYLGYVHLNDLEGPHGQYALLTRPRRRLRREQAPVRLRRRCVYPRTHR